MVLEYCGNGKRARRHIFAVQRESERHKTEGWTGNRDRWWRFQGTVLQTDEGTTGCSSRTIEGAPKRHHVPQIAGRAESGQLCDAWRALIGLRKTHNWASENALSKNFKASRVHAHVATSEGKRRFTPCGSAESLFYSRVRLSFL